MTNIVVGRYGPNEGHLMEDGTIKREWDGWIEPEDKTWIAFIRVDGSPVFFLNRDPETGGILD